MKRALVLKPLANHVGMEIQGIDLSQPLEQRVQKILLFLFQHYQLLVIRNQVLSPAAYVNAGRLFGRLAISRAPMKDKEYPQISLISNIKKAGIVVPEYWHSDAHYARKAYRGIIWHCLIAPKKGGETLYTNLRLAYEKLPTALKRLIAHKHVWYENADDERHPVSHPLVTYNSKAHVKALYVMTSHALRVEGMQAKASKQFLEKLEQHATNPAFVYTHRWRKGDVVVCDNLSLLHSATSVPRTPRLLHRLHFY